MYIEKLNIKKKVFFILLSLCLNFYLIAFAEPQVVTVNLFSNETGNTQYSPLTTLISKKLLVNLTNNKNISLNDNTSLENHNFTTNKTINGSLSKIGNFMYINIQINEVKSGKIIAAFSEKTDSTYDDIIAKLDIITEKVNTSLAENRDITVKPINPETPENNVIEKVNDSNSDAKFSVDIGAGLATQGIVLPDLSFHYDLGNNIFTLRLMKVNEFTLFKATTEDVWDIGLLYSRTLKSDFGYLSAGAGVSYISGIFRGAPIGTVGSGFLAPTVYDNIPYSAIGFPIQAEAFWTPTSLFGIGIRAYGNVNNKKSFYGGGLALQFGGSLR